MAITKSTLGIVPKIMPCLARRTTRRSTTEEGVLLSVILLTRESLLLTYQTVLYFTALFSPTTKLQHYMTLPTLSPMPLTPSLHMPIRFRVTYGNKSKVMTENDIPRYPGDVFELPCSATIGDLFYQLYLRYPPFLHTTMPRLSSLNFVSQKFLASLFSPCHRNPTDPGHEWSLASSVDRLIYRFPCKNDTPITEAFPFPIYYNQVHIPLPLLFSLPSPPCSL